MLEIVPASKTNPKPDICGLTSVPVLHERV